MKPLAIVTDIHGCFKTLQALLAKLPPDAQVICLGDMVDRGPDSKGVIEWAMNNKIICTMGNHEHMMVDFLDTMGRRGSQYDEGIWMMNGGDDSINSFKGKVPEDVRKWLSELPTYYIHPDYPHILLSHTGHGMHEDQFMGVWSRNWKFPDDKYFRIFGHTQHKEPQITDRYAMIDTGCAYKNRGLGQLTAFIVPTGQIIQQENID